MKAGVGSFNTNGVNCEFSMVDFINGQYWYAGNSYSWVDILRIVDGIKILYLCSGLLRPGDVTDCCNQLGMMATCIDVELGPERHDPLGSLPSRIWPGKYNNGYTMLSSCRLRVPHSQRHAPTGCQVGHAHYVASLPQRFTGSPILALLIERKCRLARLLR